MCTHPTEFGDFWLIEQIGAGGMADVFLAAPQDPSSPRELRVVKRLRTRAAVDPRCVAMFMDEAIVSSQLHHPNIVRSEGMRQCGAEKCLVMEYLEGQPVNALIRESLARRSLVPPRLGAHIASMALRALQHAHELADESGRPLDLVHRDVSPQNIFVTYDGTIKLLDFGIATSRASCPASGAHKRDFRGKVSYVAPETALEMEVDHRADIFAMGIVLWELLTGRRLFAGTPSQALVSVIGGPILPPSHYVSEVPRELDAIVMRALCRCRDERFGAAEDMRKALEAWLGLGVDGHLEGETARLMEYLFFTHRERRRANIRGALCALSEQRNSCLHRVAA